MCSSDIWAPRSSPLNSSNIFTNLGANFGITTHLAIKTLPLIMPHKPIRRASSPIPMLRLSINKISPTPARGPTTMARNAVQRTPNTEASNAQMAAPMSVKPKLAANASGIGPMLLTTAPAATAPRAEGIVVIIGLAQVTQNSVSTLFLAPHL